MDKDNKLIESLQHCVIACNYCASACLSEDSIQKLTSCIKLDLDCSNICNMALQLLARGSEQTIPVTELCKNICAECAEECEKHDHDHCRECAEACRRCEEQCRNYLNEQVEV